MDRPNTAEPVDGGKILLDGQDIVPLSPQKRGIGMVFQRGTFNAREVEDIVDHLEQVLGGLRRKRGILCLLFGHPAG